MYVGTKDWSSLSPSIGSGNWERFEVDKEVKQRCRLYLCPSISEKLSRLGADCKIIVWR